MKCENCGKEIPEGENKICDDCKKNLLNDIKEESKTEATEKVESVETEKVEKEKVEVEKTKEEKVEKKDDNENKDKTVPRNKIFLGIAIVVVVAFLCIIGLSIKGTDITYIFLGSNTLEGNSISNIRNYGYTAKKGSWIYFIAASEDKTTPAIYRSKKDGSHRELLYEHAGNVLALNVYKDYVYFILIDSEQNESNTKLTDEESADLTNNKICRMRLNGENVEVINNNEFHNNCYEIYAVDDKVYYIGLDANIWSMDLDGQNKTKLNNDETGFLGITNDYIILNVKKGMEMASSEDGEASTAVSTFETKVMKRDGTDLNPLTGDRLYSISVVGDYIYYVNEAKAIYKVKLDGTENTLISDAVKAYNMNVTDKYIYYMNYTDPDSQEKIGIYRMDLDGKNNTLIYTLDNYSSFLNVVDNKIVFMDTNEEEATINLINSEGEDRVKLYTLEYEDENVNTTEENVETNLNVETNTETTEEPVAETEAVQE